MGSDKDPPVTLHPFFFICRRPPIDAARNVNYAPAIMARPAGAAKTVDLRAGSS